MLLPLYRSPFSRGGGTPNGSLADDSSANSAISTQASTAFDNAKSAVNGFNYTNPTGDYGSFSDDNQNNWASGTGYTTYMRNVLYGEKSTSDDQGKISGGDKATTMIQYPQMVLLYDGKNDLDIPVIAIACCEKQKTRYVYFVVNNTNGLTYTDNDVWYGTDNKSNWVWLYSNKISSDKGQIGTLTTSNKAAQISYEGGFWGSGNFYNKYYRWANMFRFNGSFASDEYTKSITPTVTFYIGSTTTVRTDDIVNAANATKALYFVNYKAVLDRIESAKSLLNSASADKYTTASINAYAEAVIALTSFNPTSLSFSAGSLESDVNNAGTTIKNYVVAYDQAKKGLVERKYTYTFKDSASHTKSCENDSDFATVDEGHTLDSNGYCTVCNHKVFDLTAYNKAEQEAGSVGMNNAQYTSDSFNAYREQYLKAKELKDKATTQTEVDNATAMILAAKSVLRKKECTITVKKVIGDTESDVTTITKDYGTSEDIDITALTSNAVKGVEKWTITTDDGKTVTKLNTLDTSVTLYVTKDVTITAYASDEASDSTSSKVVFLGKNGRVIAVKYLAANESLLTSTVDIPSIPFYDQSKSKWDTDSVKADGSGKTIYVKAEYSCTNTDDMCTVYFNGQSKEYSYDSYVRPEGIDPTKQYALSTDGTQEHILTYLKGVDFYAPKTKEVYVIEVTERVAKIAITGSFSQRITEDDKSKRAATFNCKFYLPDDCTLVEWGAEISANGRTQVVKGESISSGNEYSITIKTTSSSLTAFTGVAYVTYKIGDQTVTIKSDSVEQKLVD